MSDLGRPTSRLYAAVSMVAVALALIVLLGACSTGPGTGVGGQQSLVPVGFGGVEAADLGSLNASSTRLQLIAGCDTRPTVDEITETATRIEILLVGQEPTGGDCASLIEVELEDPVGDRLVIDGSGGGSFALLDPSLRRMTAISAVVDTVLGDERLEPILDGAVVVAVSTTDTFEELIVEAALAEPITEFPLNHCDTDHGGPIVGVAWVVGVPGVSIGLTRTSDVSIKREPSPVWAEGACIGSVGASRLDGGQAQLATWVVAPQEELNEQTTSFTALVTGVECTNGETGRVLDPSIQGTDAAIIITFTVDPPELGDCPSNNQVAYQIELDEPIGSRSLVDGLCSAAPRLGNSVFCVDGDQRWPTE